MRSYTVVWDVDVESQFVNAWIASDSETRAMLTHIANWLDSNLADEPDLKGQPRLDLAARILAVPVSNSLARVSVTYQVIPEDRQVRVVRLVFRDM